MNKLRLSYFIVTIKLRLLYFVDLISTINHSVKTNVISYNVTWLSLTNINYSCFFSRSLFFPILYIIGLSFHILELGGSYTIIKIFLRTIQRNDLNKGCGANWTVGEFLFFYYLWWQIRTNPKSQIQNWNDACMHERQNSLNPEIKRTKTICSSS